MYDIEHPDITHVNRTGYTRDQWWEMKAAAEDDFKDQDRSEWDEERG